MPYAKASCPRSWASAAVFFLPFKNKLHGRLQYSSHHKNPRHAQYHSSFWLNLWKWMFLRVLVISSYLCSNPLPERKLWAPTLRKLSPLDGLHPNLCPRPHITPELYTYRVNHLLDFTTSNI
jgi:hypothetical protein